MADSGRIPSKDFVDQPLVSLPTGGALFFFGGGSKIGHTLRGAALCVASSAYYKNLDFKWGT
jgi:hypothetical protein